MKWFLTIFRKFRVGWGIFWIFEKFPGYLWSPLCIWPNVFKTFYHSKVIVLMKEMGFDNSQKVSSQLRQFLNFSKIACGPPFVGRLGPRVACGNLYAPPFCIWPFAVGTVREVLMKYPWAYRKEKIRGADWNLPDFFGLCPTTTEKFFSRTN
jgi:hypothetical protein